MDLGLHGKVGLVTGASAGIGYATALSLAREGASVVICARTVGPLEEAAGRIREQSGNDVLPVVADLGREADISALFQATLAQFGRLDILVNNAGTGAAAPVLSVDDAGWQRDLDLKLFGAIRTTRLAVPAMIEAGGGAIVNVVNLGAKAPGPSSLPTSVSRAAGIAFTKAASKDLAKHQIRVNAVCIGIIKSDQHLRRARAVGREHDLDAYYDELAAQRGVPLQRIGEADEVGDLIAYLASERGRYVSGIAINMDGGLSAVI